MKHKRARRLYRKPRNMNFRANLFFATLIASAIPTILCCAIVFQSIRAEVLQNEGEAVVSAADRIVTSMDSFYLHASEAVASLQNEEAIMHLMSDSREGAWLLVSNAVSKGNEMLKGHGEITLYNREGTAVYSTSSLAHEAIPEHIGGEGTFQMLYAPDVPDPVKPCFRLLAHCQDPETGTTLGHIAIDVYTEHLSNLIFNTSEVQQKIYVYTENRKPVFATTGTSLPIDLDTVFQGDIESGTVTVDANKNKMVYTIRHSKETGLSFVIFTPSNISKSTDQKIISIALGSLLMGIIICFWLSYIMSNRLYKPIMDMERAIARVEKNDLSVRIQNSSKDELGLLGEHFNSMIENLQAKQEELVRNEHELNAAQIRMLQAQLNPHFMCNTLDTMKWISKINRVPEVAIMSTDLADILRFSISPQEYVTFGTVLSMVDRYMEIQKIRLSERFEYLVNVPEEARDCQMPKMTLQPILENCIIHGVDGIENGKIEINTEIKENILYIHVKDNGPGFPADMLGPYKRISVTTDRNHLGMYNVNTILKKNYGEDSGLFLSNGEDGTGSCVTISLPVKRRNREDSNS